MEQTIPKDTLTDANADTNGNDDESDTIADDYYEANADDRTDVNDNAKADAGAEACNAFDVIAVWYNDIFFI